MLLGSAVVRHEFGIFSLRNQRKGAGGSWVIRELIKIYYAVFHTSHGNIFWHGRDPPGWLLTTAGTQYESACVSSPNIIISLIVIDSVINYNLVEILHEINIESFLSHFLPRPALPTQFLIRLCCDVVALRNWIEAYRRRSHLCKWPSSYPKMLSPECAPRLSTGALQCSTSANWYDTFH